MCFVRDKVGCVGTGIVLAYVGDAVGVGIVVCVGCVGRLHGCAVGFAVG